MKNLVKLLFLFIVGAFSACNNRQISKVYIVEEEPGYNCWPMIQPVGHKLVCVYTIGREHDPGEKGRGAYAKYSNDNAKSWSERIPVDISPSYGTSSVGKGADQNGDALFWIRRLGANPRMALFRTIDGETFELLSNPSLDPNPMQITDIYHTPSGLECLWFSDDYSDDKDNKSWGTLLSRDNGVTWEQRIIENGLSKKEWPTEPSVAVIGDGVLVAIARCEAGLGNQFQLTSTDWGRTWKKERTNIDDVNESTPTLIYDESSRTIYNYYYQRGAGLLKKRVVIVDEILNHPDGWPEPVVIAEGGRDRPYDSGNANAVAIGSKHFITWYSGDPVNCHVLTSVINE